MGMVVANSMNRWVKLTHCMMRRELRGSRRVVADERRELIFRFIASPFAPQISQLVAALALAGPTIKPLN